ncbi:hypothetical protein HDV06_003080 [Boothiomyces sp. JEL0866]|nr:hypothetical protein HDV06_000524 [Boothiomyces sp. JEL0866]KAJ3322360.1 hypothetical protein HDV06_003080 [Boothiomyces sp. JEL0866]
MKLDEERISASIIGVGVAIALNIQKQVHNVLLQRSAREGTELDSKAYLKAKFWWLGMAIMTLGELGNFAAYGFAPAVLVAPLGTVALSQIHFLNKALSSFDSTQVIPTNFVLFTTSSIIGSSIMYHDLSRTNPIALLGVISMFMGVFLITSKTEDQYTAIPDVEQHQTASQDWAAYNEWNRENSALWNPPSSWNSPTNASAQATSVPTGDLFNLNNPSQAIHIAESDTPLLPNSFKSQSIVAPSITNSSPRRTPRRNSLYPPEDDFSHSPIDSTLKRLSSVMSSIGTHQIRKLEFDHMADKTKFSKSPGSNL